MNEEKKQEIKQNLLDSSTWIRILFVVLYTIIYFLIRYLVFVIVVVNAISNLLSGKSIDALEKFTKQLNVFIFQCMEFITFASDTKPYPFAPWVQDEEAEAMHKKANQLFANKEPTPSKTETKDQD